MGDVTMIDPNVSIISDAKLLHVPLSTGDLTIGVAVKIQGGIIEWDASPLGTTTGKYDPILLEPGEAEQIFADLRKFLVGKSILEQRRIDEGILNVLGETDTGIKGANLGIAASCAAARAASAYTQKPLFLYLSEIYGTSAKVPRFMCNMLGGGGHHKNRMNITELMIMSKLGKMVPIEKFLEFRIALHKYLLKTDDSTEVGMEGCLVPQKLSDREAISILIELLKTNSLNDSVVLGIDFAALQSEDHYIEGLLNTFPEIFYVEDPFPIHEKEKYAQLIKRFPGQIIAGDDITAGNRKKIKDAISDKIINAVVMKLNHAGTITRISECVETTSKEGAITICSQRSRETAKDTLSHIALAFGFDYLKNGSPVRERIANYSNIVALSPFIGQRNAQ
jgi:enolase